MRKREGKDATGLMPTEPSTGPLAGVRVLELGSIVAGPFAGRLLADMGADVIKIEAPDRPDPLRQWGQAADHGRGLWWLVSSRNKRLVTLNLRDPKGQEMLLQLVQEADAVVENFRPGTLESWGLSYERLREANRGIILVRISGYGQTGPYASRPGFASAGEAMSGLRYVNGYPEEIPPRVGVALGDSLSGMFAVQGLLAALWHRDAGGEGEGQVVDVSILESCFAMLDSIAPEYDQLGLVRKPSGARLSGNAPSNVYLSRDHRHVVIAANHDRLFARLCATMGRDDLATDPRFATHEARGRHEDLLDIEIQAWAGRHTAAELDELLAEAEVVCAPINSIADVFADPHVQSRGMLVSHEDPQLGPVLGPNVAPRFSNTPGSVRWAGRWEVGADNDAVFGRLLGYDQRAVATLREEGVV